MRKVDFRALGEAYHDYFTKGISITILSIVFLVVGVVPFYIPWISVYHPGYLCLAALVALWGILGCYTVFIAPFLKYVLFPFFSKLFNVLADEIND